MGGPAIDPNTCSAMSWGPLFKVLEAGKIEFCVLEAASRWEGALSLLVSRETIGVARGVLAGQGYREVFADSAQSDGVERHISYDEGRRKFLVVDMCLSFGGRTARGGAYDLPWGETALADRVRDEALGADRLAPAWAFLLEVVRAALEGREACASLLRETRDRLGSAELVELMQRQLGQATRAATEGLLAAPDAHGARAWALAVRVPLEAFACAPRSRRTSGPRNGGIVIAFLGCDGSGKSTSTEEVESWLSSLFSVQRVYMGSGDGPSSWYRWPLKVVHQRLIGSGGTAQQESRRGEAKKSGLERKLRGAARLVWALVLSTEKRAKLRKAWRLRAEGSVVICDRYPQNEIMGFNDGPLLAAWRDHRLEIARRLARWEAVPYMWAAANPPDLVVKLVVSEDVASQRRPEMNREGIRRKISAIDEIRLGAARLARIDADASLEEVRREVRRSVWAAI